MYALRMIHTYSCCFCHISTLITECFGGLAQLSVMAKMRHQGRLYMYIDRSVESAGLLHMVNEIFRGKHRLLTETRHSILVSGEIFPPRI
jgi:hypothetical protein